jgi:hypothetical protein
MRAVIVQLAGDVEVVTRPAAKISNAEGVWMLFAGIGV